MRRITIILTLLLCCLSAFSNTPSSTDAEILSETHITLDSTYVNEVKVKEKKINDYSTLGLQYGVTLSRCYFNPDRNQVMTFVPVNVGLLWTKYCRMFGYMPYFGVQLGAFYTRDSYEFQTSISGYTDNILKAYKATLQTLEIPALALFHIDFWKMRIMANVGVFGGYRFTVQREYKPNISESYKEYATSFHVNENRFDYGIKAGAGFAFIIDPIEIHITGAYKHSWSNLHQPNVNGRTLEHDDNSKYYYKWSYPTNIIIAVGIHYQITNRIGKTKRQLRQDAKNEVKAMFEEPVEKK